MDKETLALVLALLPQVPLILRVCLLHVLRLSESAKYLDLRSAVTVSVIRSLIAPSRPATISETQRLTLRDPGIKGRIWVSKYTAPRPPETGVRDVLLAAIAGMRPPADPSLATRRPDIVPVEAEWTGYRAAANARSTLPPISEREKYAELMKECKSPVTVLFFHGGAYYLLDPSSHRPTTKKLAKLTGGRCYSVRYRLAPQNPFPSALQDALLSYLTLLYPAPDAFHEPVDPKHVVFAGDSAGGNLSMALLQTILEIRRQNAKVMWFGQEREVPLPGCAALSSPWVDMTLSSESWQRNAEFDYLPASAAQRLEAVPPCEVWPAKPPRMSYYADDAFLDHPLVTIALAADWRGAPPVYMSVGWELLADEQKFLASKLHASGVKVVFEEYEAMPHCFAMILSRLAEARRCFDGWTGFIRSAIEDPSGVESRGVTIKAKSLEEVELDLGSLCDLSDEDVKEQVQAQIASHLLASKALPPPKL
ncbi:related to acetyl-hydrolase [Cephalotrichum gorgonifer]|uniref:Related to acetyl-hydrolase n=1 Tax=Cephalotrichum gorgonifer TaxID=2041049 RepID=A0AAE8MXP6_9PEZI|nr:related to acetyl-hydrolase [Cephalotrichum gorgonifer]